MGTYPQLLESTIMELTDKTDNPVVESPPEPKLFPRVEKGEIQLFPFESPAHLLAFFDPDIRDGRVTQHHWQAQLCLEMTRGWSFPENPLKLNLLAVNGSGKDLMFIAPYAIWRLLCLPESLTVITSSSANQLEGQTSRYIQRLAEKVNSYYGDEVVHITEHELWSKYTKGFINLFVTNEEGRAEGWHPLAPGRSMALITNEAKSVPDCIDDSFTRCNGADVRINVSSPGKPEGFFFDRYTSGEDYYQDSSPNQKRKNNQNWKNLRITADDCPHLGGERYVQSLVNDYGEGSALVRALLWAEFTTIDEQVVIHAHQIAKVLKFPPAWAKEEKNFGGLDLSGGGDEDSLTVRNGNKILAIEAFRESDTLKKVARLEFLFKKWKLGVDGSVIDADAGGIGKPICDLLRAKGYKLRLHFNQSNPRDLVAYENKGTEMWFTFQRMIEELEVILVDDKILKKQLCSRYFKYVNRNDTTVAQLESKQQARSKGHPSPDRGDSTVLAFYNYKPPRIKKILVEWQKRRKTLEQNKVVTIHRLVQEVVKQDFSGLRSGPRLSPRPTGWIRIEKELEREMVKLRAQMLVTKPENN